MRLCTPKTAYLLTILIAILYNSASFAGWSENVRLTYRGNEIMPQVIASHDTVHVVWRGYGKVSYIRSTDGGNTWGNIIDLNATGHTASEPTLNLGQRGLLVSWHDRDTTQPLYAIAIAKSTDNGTTWSRPSYVWTDNPNHFNYPVSAVKDDSIFLVYYSYRNDSTGSCPFRALHSYNYGQTWSEEVTIGHPVQLAAQPIRLSYCNGNLLLAYSCIPDSNHFSQYYIIGNRSADAGRTWSDTIWISPHILYTAQSLSLSCNAVNGQFLVGYTHDRYQIYAYHGDIFATISDDGGVTWPNEYQATNNHTAWVPAIDYVADTLVAVWSDMRYYEQGRHEIVFNRSNDGGNTWLGEQRLTYTEANSYSPWVSFDNGRINVVWVEDVDSSGYEIFYKKFTPDSSDNIVEQGSSPLPIFSLSAYPNPFNSTTTLFIGNGKASDIFIYDITGRQIATLNAKDGKAVWDASAYSSGIYFARAICRGGPMCPPNSAIIKLIYLK